MPYRAGIASFGGHVISQLIAVGAVLVGASATYVATYLLNRQRNRFELSTRWDGKKLDRLKGLCRMIFGIMRLR